MWHTYYQHTIETFDIQKRLNLAVIVDQGPTAYLTPKIVYQVEVQDDTNDKMKFTHEKYRNSNELQKYIWQLKDRNTTPIATWRLVAKVLSETKIN